MLDQSLRPELKDRHLSLADAIKIHTPAIVDVDKLVRPDKGATNFIRYMIALFWSRYDKGRLHKHH